ncbi:MAG TPA: hypothetical protein VHC90_20435 [Bryobacteraceae bacterium]|nr:hypothetical protein [Bryobacteraceae bacterium]
MNLELARNGSFGLVILIGLCGLSLLALHLLDKVISGVLRWIGFWPFLTDAVWKYAKSRSEKDARKSGDGR